MPDRPNRTMLVDHLARIVAVGLVAVIGACEDDPTDLPDVSGDAESSETGDVADTAGGDGSGDLPCGPSLTCSPGQYCIADCLCCGIDTGNPADQRTEYRCVTPDPGCTDSPDECVQAAEACYMSGDRLCASPCA